MTSEVDNFLLQYPNTLSIDAFIVDLCGNAIGKRHLAPDFHKLFESGSRICASSYLLDARCNSSDPLGLGFSDGDPDAVSLPVPGTLVPVPWASERRAQCLMTLTRPDTHEQVWFEPRVVLERVLSRYSEIGLEPVVAVELEFYLIDKHRDQQGRPQPPVSPHTGIRSNAGQVYGFDVLDEFSTVLKRIQQACDAQGLPTTVASSEYGVGQFEINLLHTDQVLQACDHAAMQRRAIKGACRAEGFDATFMSKPFPDQSGNGLHIHVSLQNEKGNAAFDAAVENSDALLESAVAGLQSTMHEAFAIFSPNLNAFRRFQANQFVPVTRDWGIDNRSVAFRIVDRSNSNRRIEHRVAGAEANPYLVMASVLAGIHHGISMNLKPTAIATGNAGATVDETLPLTPWRAFKCMQNAKILPDYLGADYIEAYTQVKAGEFAAFMGTPFSRELEWYL